MRKIKKINGFLVVKFNDREKREYEGTALGEYGVIDAEVYTGNLDIDRGAMEYDDADTLEVAVELARGLESEEDITDEPSTYTAAVETNESYTEETVEPTALIEGWTRRLATQVKSKHYPDTDPRTAAHELYGFKMALHQIGFLPESEVITDPDTFGAGRLDGPMPRNPEELLAFVCDERCKNRAGHTQEELDAICAKCPLGQLYEDAEAQDLRIRERSERALQEHIEGVRRAEDTLTALLGGHEALAYQGVISFATNGELWDAWESIFTDLSNDNRQEDALEFFQANREAMLEGTAVLWEEKLSYYDLMVIRISEGEASFNSEIQNDPIDPENCTFQEEWFDFWDDEGKAQPDFSDPKFLFVGANDPSLGKNKKSDTSSIIALAKDTQTGYLYVVIADIAKRKPDQIIEDALDASRRLQREYKRPYYKFGVETVQFQYYFAEIMRQRAAAVGEYLPIEEINSTQNKDARIQSLQPFVKNGYIKFSKKHKTLLKQMTEYPMGKNDDAPDGLQMAVKLALDVKIGRRVDYRSVIARALDFRRGAY